MNAGFELIVGIPNLSPNYSQRPSRHLAEGLLRFGLGKEPILD